MFVYLVVVVVIAVIIIVYSSLSLFFSLCLFRLSIFFSAVRISRNRLTVKDNVVVVSTRRVNVTVICGVVGLCVELSCAGLNQSFGLAHKLVDDLHTVMLHIA